MLNKMDKIIYVKYKIITCI